MKLLKKLSQPTMALMLASVSLTAFAQDFSRSIDDRDLSGQIGDNSDDDQIQGSVRPITYGDNLYCQNYSAYDCDQIPGCQYSRIYSQCVASSGPVRPIPQNPSYCSNYTYNQIQCQQQGCFYDLRNGACLDNNGPGPRPYPGPGPGPGPRPYPGPGPGPRPYPGPGPGPGPRPYPGPGPGPRPGPQHGFMCVAEDNGFEEHRGGHQGLGRTQFEATQQALAICRSQHGDCHVTSCIAE